MHAPTILALGLLVASAASSPAPDSRAQGNAVPTPGPSPQATIPAQPIDHAISEQGNGAAGRAELTPIPTDAPVPLDHAINTKGTGSNNGRAPGTPAGPPPAPGSQDHAIDAKGTGTNNGGTKPKPATPK